MNAAQTRSDTEHVSNHWIILRHRRIACRGPDRQRDQNKAGC